MLRFVPVESSLEDNAPGYDDPSRDTSGDFGGPICWKCNGAGSVNKKLTIIECKVCKGNRRLPVKLDVQKAKTTPGVITKQTLPSGWEPRGPRCVHATSSIEELPPELSLHDGEQLCVFVGDWRIIQRKGGHRWTTDDLVTAWVAGRRSTERAAEHTGRVQHSLDLGCGNGAVLMMVAWQYPDARCFGMEARSEAVALARRSITYNLGNPGSSRVTVTNQDFRELIPDTDLRNRSGVGVIKAASDDEETAEAEQSMLSQTFDLPDGVKFDLVTGTPPYFQVDFAVTKKIDSSTSTAFTFETARSSAAPSTVERAIIRQGGMPTCKESAPARCEFRGGIEAYCAAAAATLAVDGVFVVCENYANHERALVAARNASLQVVSVQRVLGKEGKLPLFCVYSMVHMPTGEGSVRDCVGDASVGVSGAVGGGEQGSGHPHYEADLVVRDKNGAWTPQYAQLLRDMSYPVASLHPNGKY